MPSESALSLVHVPLAMHAKGPEHLNSITVPDGGLGGLGLVENRHPMLVLAIDRWRELAVRLGWSEECSAEPVMRASRD